MSNTSSTAQRYRELKAQIPIELKRPVRNAVDTVQRSAQTVMGPTYFKLFPGWHRRNVGDFWETMGEHQREFLVGEGLKPDHWFLDVGCGGLRGGLEFIRYLEPGHYHGIDKEAGMIAAAGVELERAGLSHKSPVLLREEHFDLGRLGRTFDFVMAQSVFTHLPINDILICLANVDHVLAPGGRFYATFFNSTGGRFAEPIDHKVRTGGVLTSYPDRDPYHYDVDMFEWMCRDLSIDVTYIGDWNHPREQEMLVFARPGEQRP